MDDLAIEAMIVLFCGMLAALITYIIFSRFYILRNMRQSTREILGQFQYFILPILFMAIPGIILLREDMRFYMKQPLCLFILICVVPIVIWQAIRLIRTKTVDTIVLSEILLADWPETIRENVSAVSKGKIKNDLQRINFLKTEPDSPDTYIMEAFRMYVPVLDLIVINYKIYLEALGHKILRPEAFKGLEESVEKRHGCRQYVIFTQTPHNMVVTHIITTNVSELWVTFKVSFNHLSDLLHAADAREENAEINLEQSRVL